MTYLINTQETYRADTEAEAAALIKAAKENNDIILSKYSSVKREKKQKGEVVDEWYKVVLVKTFDDEKEPYNNVTISYDIDGGAF